MALFNNLELTNLGVEHIKQLIISGGSPIVYTALVLGDGELPEDKTPADMTDLVNERARIHVETHELNEHGRLVIIEGILNSGELKADLYHRELGVYVMGNDNREFLFAYGNAGDDYDFVPAPGKNASIIKHIKTTFSVGGLKTIFKDLPSGMYVTYEAFETRIRQILPGMAAAAVDEAFRNIIGDGLQIADDGVISTRVATYDKTGTVKLSHNGILNNGGRVGVNSDGRIMMAIGSFNFPGAVMPSTIRTIYDGGLIGNRSDGRLAVDPATTDRLGVVKVAETIDSSSGVVDAPILRKALLELIYYLQEWAGDNLGIELGAGGSSITKYNINNITLGDDPNGIVSFYFGYSHDPRTANVYATVDIDNLKTAIGTDEFVKSCDIGTAASRNVGTQSGDLVEVSSSGYIDTALLDPSISADKILLDTASSLQDIVDQLNVHTDTVVDAGDIVIVASGAAGGNYWVKRTKPLGSYVVDDIGEFHAAAGSISSIVSNGEVVDITNGVADLGKVARYSDISPSFTNKLELKSGLKVVNGDIDLNGHGRIVGEKDGIVISTNLGAIVSIGYGDNEYGGGFVFEGHDVIIKRRLKVEGDTISIKEDGEIFGDKRGVVITSRTGPVFSVGSENNLHGGGFSFEQGEVHIDDGNLYIHGENKIVQEASAEDDNDVVTIKDLRRFGLI